jgi:hypothetical protein
MSVQIFFAICQHSILAECFLAVAHQGREILPFEQTGHFAGSQQRVHTLQECGVQHVAFVEDETDALVLHTGTSQDGTKILVEILRGVVL